MWPIASIGSPPTSSVNGTLRSPAVAAPSFSVSSPRFTPSFFASVDAMSPAASATAEPELAAPIEPPEPKPFGKFESPSRTVTRCIGTPRISPAIWDRIV